MNIYSWLRDHAAQRPDKVAIRFKDTAITYRELFSLTGKLGTALRDAGISRGDNVAVMLPNIPEFIISYMGAIGIGAVAVPVNPTFTSRELAHILKDSEAKGIVIEENNFSTYGDIQDRFPLNAVITTGESGNFSQWTAGADRGICEDMDLDDTAAMVYSSGLTGNPMGAMLTQRNLDHNSDLMRICGGADDTDTTLTLIPCFHSFSASVNMLSMLRYGGTVYLIKSLDFRELSNVLKNGGITCLCAVPTLFFGLLHHPDVQDVDYSRMKIIIAGGSALSMEVYKGFKERFGVDIRQGYGITEATPVCAYNANNIPLKPMSIGPAVPGVEARIMDDEGRVLGPNEKGEIIFKGPNIMKGYYKKEKETREIIRDGWLYTGDLGYMDEDGYIYITGYKKEMIITSGFNVYNKEVENVLNSIPGVKDSAVVGIPDLMRGAIIKAFVVTSDPNLSESDVKRQARRMLAPYKTPRKVEFVAVIPRDKDGRALVEEIERAK
ncbi:MAG TPA: AMP-binding protein [Deltaproteobacteria bacterium]|nr:AMP-binding protein [Deltaproteobacteria bacterium]HOI08250.1 AMP-binding protein [Deltaproteobacteria bacterium]